MIHRSYSTFITASLFLYASFMFNVCQAFVYRLCNKSKESAHVEFEFHCPMYLITGRAEKRVLDLKPGESKPVESPGIIGARCLLSTKDFKINGKSAQKYDWDTDTWNPVRGASTLFLNLNEKGEWEIYEKKGNLNCPKTL